jgi:hypothetical protein
MNNFGKKNIDEKAELIKKKCFCKNCLDDDKCIHSDKCLKGVKQWLEQESEEE